MPESQFTFQITLPTGGFWGVGLKPWEERERSAFEILPEVQARVARIPGIQTFPILPPALPGGGRSRSSSCSLRPPSREILGFAQKLQAKATASGLFAFPPLIDVKIDQPESEIELDRDKVAELGLDLQTVGKDLAAAVGGNFVNRFSVGGRSYKVIPQLVRAERLNAEQLEDLYVTGPNGQLVALSSIARIRESVRPRSLNRFQQLNAVKISGVAVRPLDEALGRSSRARQRGSCRRGLRHRLHGRVAPAAHRGEQVPARISPRRRADLPGARRAVQQLPRPVRDPRRLGCRSRCSARSS